MKIEKIGIIVVLYLVFMWFMLWSIILWLNWGLHDFVGFPPIEAETHKMILRDYDWTTIALCSIMLFGGIVWLIPVGLFYENALLLEGMTRAVRREEHKLLKTKAKVKALKLKKDNVAKTVELEKERQKIQCELKLLKLEPRDYKICAMCNKKMLSSNCFCPKCGGALFEQISEQ